VELNEPPHWAMRDAPDVVFVDFNVNRNGDVPSLGFSFVRSLLFYFFPI